MNSKSSALVLALGALSCSFVVVACEADSASAPDVAPDGGATDGGVEAPIDCPAPTAGPTKHAGDVKGDTVWTAAGSPHIVERDVNVRDGAKLTIEPCAEVRLAAGAKIQVAYPLTPNTGTLIAEGTAEKPITFSGEDGARWGSVYVHAPGTARFAYAKLEGGGGGDFDHGATLAVYGDGEVPAKPLLFVDHVTVAASLGTGVFMARRSTFMPGSTDLTITKSGSDAYPYPLEMSEHAIDALPTGSYTGNAKDEIFLSNLGVGTAGTGLAVDATLHERGVPYRVGENKRGDFIVGGEEGTVTTLTIEPGVVMRFEPETAFKVQTFTTDKPSTAAVRALGTADKPIVFTSAASTPKAGDWRGLWFGGIPQPTNAFEHVRVEYAGFHCSCSLNSCSSSETRPEAAFIFTAQPPSAFIRNSVFKDVAGNAVTQGFDGVFVDFRPTNTFERVSGCVQTLPRELDGTCPNPKPVCDGR
ncbi:MAG: hypothetical protein KF764_20545 [Labilithrix sp.]|nr:hypothetical protein [Labilithrix sp.]